jgi:uncharacterized protein (TIGR02145 family)
MKKTLLFIFSLLTLSLLAQDGINYQGAATDVNGDELTNQNITLRASVLSGGASGNLEWEETHSATTDQFGLFNVVIGQGTNTTNGATTIFNDMDWGSADHFLKIEMDATGGTNYAMIGTTQMMSVPYALYAKSAGIDSTMLANMIGSSGGGMGGGGCNFNYPDGLDGDPIIFSGYYNDYTVPTGKTLYITTPYVTSNWEISIDGIDIGSSLNNNTGQAVHNAIVANEGQIVGGEGNFHGLLFDNSVIEAITWQFSTAYTVPLGKELFILHQYGPGGVSMEVDGVIILGGGNRAGQNYWSLGAPIKLIAGQVVSCSYNLSSFNGYLVDENYFAGCGGGGSSSSASAVDSAMVAGMIANAGGGGGTFGDFIPITTSIETQAPKDGFLFGNYEFNSHAWLKIYCDTFSGNSNIRALIEPNPNYFIWERGNFMIPIKEGEYFTIEFSSYGNSILNNAYFVPLESGGGSSSASSGLDSATVATMIANAVSATNSSTSVSTFGDTLFINGQAIIIPGLSYTNVIPTFGSVTDASGNTYPTIDYGSAGVWMTENLNTANFANGDPIPMITGSYSSSNYPPSWAWADNNSSNEAIYGKHYNGTAITDSRNVCPSGWHLPSENEWIQLILLFGGATGTGGCNNCVGGDNLKSDISWNGNNQSYMSIVPGGSLNSNGGASGSNSSGYYWITDYVGGNGGYGMHFHNDSEISKSSHMYYSFLSVRCVKD